MEKSAIQDAIVKSLMNNDTVVFRSKENAGALEGKITVFDQVGFKVGTYDWTWDYSDIVAMS